MTYLRTLTVIAVLLLLLLATGCGTEPSALEGSWTPERGAVAFSPGEMPYTYHPRASAAAGGVIVEAAQDGYSVTLVSSNGDRRTASSAAMKDDALLVDFGAGQLSLTEDSADRVLMLWTTDGIPAPGSGVYLRAGTPAPQ